MSKLTEIEELAAATTSDPRWQSIVLREKDADGKFFYSVGTTGVYCRPSCAARLPRPENVRFHTSTADAEKAGFRACKRCKPTGLSLTAANTAKIEKVCRLIERAPLKIYRQHIVAIHEDVGFHGQNLADNTLGSEEAALDMRGDLVDHDARRVIAPHPVDGNDPAIAHAAEALHRLRGDVTGMAPASVQRFRLNSRRNHPFRPRFGGLIARGAAGDRPGLTFAASAQAAEFTGLSAQIQAAKVTAAAAN